MKANQRTLWFWILCIVLTVGGVLFSLYLSPTPLSAPQDLRWHHTVNSSSDESGEEAFSISDSSPGTIYWKAGSILDPSGSTDFSLCLYRDNALIHTQAFSYGNTDLEDHTYNAVYLCHDLEFDSGSYRFTLQAVTDTAGYRDSKVAASETWVYEKPEAQFEKPQNITWGDGIITWDADSESCEYHEIEYYWASAADEEPRLRITSWCNPCKAHFEDSWYMEDPGCYYVRVRVLSPDITKYQNSQWSELSEPYFVAESN